MPYTWKFLWSPLLDRYALPLLGRRRGWMLVTQVVLLLVDSACSACLNPTADIWAIALSRGDSRVLLSASQDIVLDAYPARNPAPTPSWVWATSIHVNAYRISSLVPGSLALILADHLPWSTVFVITALFMLPGIAMTLIGRRAAARRRRAAHAARSGRRAVPRIHPRAGWRAALLVLPFIFLYKLGDSMATALATPFYLDMGFTKTEIGVIAKNAGLWASVIGGMLGGLWMVKIGINRGAVAVRRRAARIDPGFRVARRRQRAGPAAARRRDRIRGARRRPRHRRVRRVTSRARPIRVTPRRNSRCSRASPPCRARSSSVDRRGSSSRPAGSISSCLCTLLALPGMLLLPQVAPWNGDRPARDPATQAA